MVPRADKLFSFVAALSWRRHMGPCVCFEVGVWQMGFKTQIRYILQRLILIFFPSFSSPHPFTYLLPPQLLSEYNAKNYHRENGP